MRDKVSADAFKDEISLHYLAVRLSRAKKLPTLKSLTEPKKPPSLSSLSERFRAAPTFKQAK